MAECFTAQRHTQIELTGSPDQVKEFFQAPERLVEALLEPDRVTQLDQERFSVGMGGLGGLGIWFQPVVTLRIIASDSGGSDLEIIDCNIEGNSWLNNHFSLEFDGDLNPTERNLQRAEGADQSQTIQLEGEAYVKVCIDIPPVLRFTPRSLLNSAGSRILDGILAMIQRSLQTKLPRSFQAYQASPYSLVHHR